MNLPRTATIAALEPTELLILGADAFNDLVRLSHNVSRSLERTSSRRLLLLVQSRILAFAETLNQNQ